MTEEKNNIKYTAREMCELISEYMKSKYDEDMTAEEIWHSSPTGELYQVFDLFVQAYEWKYGKMFCFYSIQEKS